MENFIWANYRPSLHNYNAFWDQKMAFKVYYIANKLQKCGFELKP